MTLDELEALCRQAATDLLARHGRPLPDAVVVPTASVTRVLTLPDLPADQGERRRALARLAEQQLRPQAVPCWGFIAEAVAAGEVLDVDVCLVAFGAHGHAPQVTAAPFEGEGLGAFAVPEPLEDGALPELAPLQDAVEQAASTDAGAVAPGPLDLWPDRPGADGPSPDSPDAPG